MRLSVIPVARPSEALGEGGKTGIQKSLKTLDSRSSSLSDLGVEDLRGNDVLSRFLSFLYPLTLPLSLAYHFRLPSSFVYGVPVDYLMPAIFLSDLVGGALFCTFILLRFCHSERTPLSGGSGGISHENAEISRFRYAPLEMTETWIKKLKKEPALLVALTLLIAALPLSLQLAWIQAWYEYFRLIWMIVMIFILSFLWRESHLKEALIKGIMVSLSVQSLWALVQVILGGNLTPYFPFGETNLTKYSPAIAKINVLGHSFLRGYGTTPHPNVLGGILVIYLLLVLSNYSNRHSRARGNPDVWVHIGAVTVGVLGLLATASRSAFLALGLSLIYVGWQGKFKFRFQLILLIIILTAILFSIFPLSATALSVTERWEYLKTGGLIFRNNPLTGIGLNQFIYHLPFNTPLDLTSRTLQPIHNIWVLWLVETGIVGLIAIIAGLRLILSWLKGGSRWSQAIFIALIVLGSLDHYLLTLPMGMGVLALALSYIWTARVTLAG